MKKLSSLRQLNKKLEIIKKYRAKMKSLSDKALSSMTFEFKARLNAGETLEDILPEAFAAICEADARVLGKFPYDVQIIGGMALHEGYLAEMNTGEGKTLTATMPLYLNALTGKSCILVTANEHLAIRDAEEMGQVYNFMGLTVKAGAKAKSTERFTDEEKKEVYAADIVYTTHGALGFDYLFNNLATSAEGRFLREFYYCIIDEADSVLLDAAQMPLVISGSPRVQSNLYNLADFFVTTLVEERDYELEDKKVWFTEEGIERAEKFFRIDNFYGEEYFEVNRHVMLALRAHILYEKGKDYVVSNKGGIVLLDNGSGRMVPGVKIGGGLHQALEVKEKINLTQETRSVASITYQNLFKLFPKMAGMSGTISDAKEELLDVYNKQTIVIPPNKPLARIDYKDEYYNTTREQFHDAIDEVIAVHEKGQPVLVVASTIGETETVSKVLMKHHIAHCVLNANNAFWEAEMIAEAGQMNAVTVATSMAGRGTDIKLGDGVKELGGLAVIGIGRMGNTRLERQARGRAGRQGDPGFSKFFVACEDEIVTQHCSKKVLKKIESGKRYSKRRLRGIIDGSRKVSEEQSFSSRGRAMDYDKVMRKQRQIMYETRNRLLDGGTIEFYQLSDIANEVIDAFLDENKVIDKHMLSRFILDNISYRLNDKFNEVDVNEKMILREYLYNCFWDGVLERKVQLANNSLLDEFYRKAVLMAIDAGWIEQVDYLQQLQYAVSGRSSAQKNPVFEYQKDAYESFTKMELSIKKNIIRNVLLSDVKLVDGTIEQIILP